ncbi:MAG: cell division protein FtsA [Candidatus Sungbacteria bacterium RIFCSPHIGHO2_01_FULL_50_25]|uniref:Cell division protein FtsA n=1 Tax=Candidatus Sungbacteria bacterium RIFCSPHIGHO2_01_FULL_50_25 TaxID=1802265 RepID=A0A1G2K867_9BACT|nr:MAG: cell division protein FtsA [Candidatus Sungbacteria bacterium RIFCSPHIGHO2_01_FULL_50_25]
MGRNIITALDIGTSTIHTIVAEEQRREGGLRILGVGVAPSAGVRRGAIVDIEEAAQAIRKSVDEARRSSGVPIKSVWVSVGGTAIFVSSSRGVVAVSRADGEISHEDVKRAVAAAQSFLPRQPNRETLHIIPRDFKVDNESGVKDPVGMHGVRLEADTLIIECSSSFLKNLTKTIEHVGLSVDDYVFSPLATAEAVLTKRQKELGVLLLDIGGGTASFVVYEEGAPMQAGVLPVGGAHITNDIAIGFRTHVDVAEAVKLAYGSCIPDDLPKREHVRLADFVEGETAVYSRRELAEIIEARMGDVFELLARELKKINRTELLPAGVVMVGGTSLLPGILGLARKEMRLPIERGILQEFSSAADDTTMPSFAPAFGVVLWAYKMAREDGAGWGRGFQSFSGSRWAHWLRSLIP